MRKAYLAYLLIATAFLLTGCWLRVTPPPTLVPTLTPSLPASGRPISFSDIVNVVETRPSEADVFVLAGLGQKIGPGAQVRTGEASFARIDLEQDGIMRLGPKTLITLLALPTAPDDPLARIRLSNGKIWISLQAGGMEVETPAGVAALRGAYAEFEYWQGAPDDPADDVMVVRCLVGVCGVQMPAGSLIVLGRMELLTTTTNNQPPSRAALGLDAIAEFVQNNPESADLVATLTAGAPTATPTPTPTFTASATATNTSTPTATATRTITLTPTRTRIPSTHTPTPTSTVPSPTPTQSYTPSATSSVSRSLTPSISPTSTPSTTPTVPAASFTPTATQVMTWTATPTLTGIPMPTSTATETSTSLPTLTPTSTDTSTPVPTSTDTPTSTETPTPTPT